MNQPPRGSLLHYTLSEKLGEGGMGEVYRATDTKLKRGVAIKFLPDSLSRDPERLARFQREAEMLAQLQHPNIASIYGFEEADGKRALVMELVEGITLAERIDRGALPVDEALAIAEQIAVALEEAHAKGIVHRDLKPANVKLTVEGHVKVLDFGLAKAFEPASHLSGSSPQSTLSHSPTLTMGTQLGVILGTASYMSPEQARGAPIDSRADVWAFGVVLYEMLAGRRLFEGETVSDVLAGVLKSEIDFELLAADTPAPIRRLLRRCLERKPNDRLHSVADARIVIREVLVGKVDEPAVFDAGTEASRRGGRLPWLIAAVSLVALFITVVVSRGGKGSGAGTYELSLAPPADHSFLIGSNSGWAVLSPDGKRIVVRVSGPDGTGLWLRSLDGAESRLLPGTSEGFYPFWSPDGRWVLFFTRGSLSRVEVAGGLPERVCAAPWGRGGSWSAESGRILLAPVGGGAIHVVPAEGGDTRPVTQLDRQAGETAHYWPVWLPDGERFLYFIRSSGRENEGIYLGRVPEEGIDEERRRVVASSSSGLLVAGPDGAPLLLWIEDETLLARAFDLETGTVSGTTTRVAEGVGVLDSQRGALVSASDNGNLAWASPRFGRFRLGWFDRNGGGPYLVDTPELNIYQPTTSPDGRMVSFVVVKDGQGDIWLLDVASGQARALTSSVEYDETVAWAPDSKQIVFQSGGTLRRMRVDGSDSPTEIVGAEIAGLRIDGAPAWLPGDWIAISTLESDGSQDLYVSRLDGTDAGPLIVGPGSQIALQVSPDGRALLYRSDETGTQQSYLVSLAEADGRPIVGRDRQRIPVDDVQAHAFSLEGDQIFAVTIDGTLYAVPVDTKGPVRRLGTPERLFQQHAFRGIITFGVAPHGERFLFKTAPAAEYQPLSVLLDWRSRLE